MKWEIRILLIFSLSSNLALCFNVAQNPLNSSMLFSPVYQSFEAANENNDELQSTFFGYEIGISSNVSTEEDHAVFNIGSPKLTNYMQPNLQANHSTDNQFPTGGISQCRVSKDNLDEAECALVSTPPATDMGMIMQFTNQSHAMACSITQLRDCNAEHFLPGFCYETFDGFTWTLKTKEFECPIEPVDVIFLLDGSNSVGSSNFVLVKDWVKAITQTFVLGPQATQVGVIQYSYYDITKAIDQQLYIKTEIALGNTTTYEDFEQRLNAIKLQGFTTATGAALRKTKLDFETYSRQDATKVLILITDGQSDDSVSGPAIDLRNMGVLIFSVGVGAIDENELKLIATGNTSSLERVFKVSDFSALEEISSMLTVSIRNYVLEGTGSGDNVSLEFHNAQQGFSLQYGEFMGEFNVFSLDEEYP